MGGNKGETRSRRVERYLDTREGEAVVNGRAGIRAAVGTSGGKFWRASRGSFGGEGGKNENLV